MQVRLELLLSVALYIAALLLAALSNVWLNAWGRQLSLISTYFHLHPISAEGDSVSPSSSSCPSGPALHSVLNPFDLAGLERSIAAAVTADSSSSDGAAAGDALLSTCDSTVNAAPVFDLGLHLFPHLGHRWLPDAFVFVMLPLLVLAVFWPYTHPLSARARAASPALPAFPLDARKDSESRYPLPAAPTNGEHGHSLTSPAAASVQAYWPPTMLRLCCVLQSHAIILLMRTSTTLATVHRASPVCHSQALEFSANPGFVLNVGCFDLMFSGHTAFCTLAALFTCSRPGLSIVAQAAVSVLAAIGCVANVLVGDHFSSDVLVGGYVALLVCLLYRTRYKRSFTAPRAVHGRRLEVGVGESRRVEVDASGKGKAAAVPEDDPMDVDDEEEQSGEAEAVDLQHLLSRVNKLKLHEADG